MFPWHDNGMMVNQHLLQHPDTFAFLTFAPVPVIWNDIWAMNMVITVPANVLAPKFAASSVRTIETANLPWMKIILKFL